MPTTPSPEELEVILTDWQDFARTKVFAFRGMTEAAYALFSPAYFRAIASRSDVRVEYQGSELVACIITERVNDSDAVIVHWAWTHRGWRNMGEQRRLWAKLGLDKANVFISHLTVVAEKLCPKYGWLFNSFPLYKGLHNVSESNQTHSLEAGDIEGSRDAGGG